MSEIKKIRRVDKIRALAIGEIAEKHGVTRDYIRATLRGDNVSGIADEVLKEYPLLYERIKKAINAG